MSTTRHLRELTVVENQQWKKYGDPLLLDRPIVQRILPERVTEPALKAVALESILQWVAIRLSFFLRVASPRAIANYHHSERGEQEDQPEPDLDLRERRIVVFEL